MPHPSRSWWRSMIALSWGAWTRLRCGPRCHGGTWTRLCFAPRCHGGRGRVFPSHRVVVAGARYHKNSPYVTGYDSERIRILLRRVLLIVSVSTMGPIEEGGSVRVVADSAVCYPSVADTLWAFRKRSYQRIGFAFMWLATVFRYPTHHRVWRFDEQSTVWRVTVSQDPFQVVWCVTRVSTRAARGSTTGIPGAPIGGRERHAVVRRGYLVLRLVAASGTR